MSGRKKNGNAKPSFAPLSASIRFRTLSGIYFSENLPTSLENEYNDRKKHDNFDSNHTFDNGGGNHGIGGRDTSSDEQAFPVVQGIKKDGEDKQAAHEPRQNQHWEEKNQQRAQRSQQI